VILRLLIWALLAYIGYRIVVRLIKGKEKEPELNTVRDNTAITYQDPICGVYVSEEDAVIGRLDGERHYFCSKECLEKFQDKLVNKK
jgi:YHS domain-containing protein